MGIVEKKIGKRQVTAISYKGPYSEASMAIGALTKYAYKNDYDIIGLPIETYLSNPNETPESDLVTKMTFPVMKNR